MEYTAIINNIDDWWVGWIEEIPGVNCQEKTRSELLESLKVTLKEAIDFNREDALLVAGKGYEKELIVVWKEANSWSTCENMDAICYVKEGIIRGG